MKIHERHVPVEEARRELLKFLDGWALLHRLTAAERLALLAEEVNRDLWLHVRHERGPS